MASIGGSARRCPARNIECPDFFELPIDGDGDHRKWVLIQGNGNYSIGTFDGVGFKEETTRRPCDVGPNFYATQSWHNTETGEGRRIQAAGIRGSDFRDMPFNLRGPRYPDLQEWPERLTD